MCALEGVCRRSGVTAACLLAPGPEPELRQAVGAPPARAFGSSALGNTTPPLTYELFFLLENDLECPAKQLERSTSLILIPKAFLKFHDSF